VPPFSPPLQFQPAETLVVSSLPFPCRWILSRLSAASAAVVKGMHVYDFATATQSIYSWWQYDLCDVFIELAKPAITGADDAARAATRDTLWVCLETGLRLLHPFMPFVTEELWQRLPRRPGQEAAPSIMVAQYPAAVPEWADPGVEADMAYLLTVVNRTRSLRADYGLAKQRPPLFVSCRDAARAALLTSCLAELGTLTTTEAPEVLDDGRAAPHGCGVAIIDETTTVYLALAGILDAAKEIEKLAKKEAEAVTRVRGLSIFFPFFLLAITLKISRVMYFVIDRNLRFRFSLPTYLVVDTYMQVLRGDKSWCYNVLYELSCL
jgi:valyl-tRNA synthetase